MTWLNAAALAWLALVPLVVLLYFMKLRRTRQEVSAVFLWRRALEEARVDRFSSRLRANLLLLLQILLILFLALALARPALLMPGREARLVILVLDSSAAMQADQGGHSRFELARKKALDLVKGAPSGTAFLVIAATRKARLVTPLTPDKTVVKEALLRLQPQDSGSDLYPALRLAASLSRQRSSASIYLIGCHDPTPSGGRGFDSSLPPDLQGAHPGGMTSGKPDAPASAGRGTSLPGQGLPESLIYLPVGTPVDNIGITAFSVEKRRGGGYRVFALVSSFASHGQEVSADLSLNGRVVDSRRTLLPRGRSVPLTFDLSSAAQGGLELALRLPDALLVDNYARAQLPPTASSKVLLVSRGNPFLERLLSILPGIVYLRQDPGQFSGPGDARVVILDNLDIGTLPAGALSGAGASAPGLPAGNYLAFHSILPRDLVPVTGQVKHPQVTDWRRDSPLLRQLAFGDLGLVSAYRIPSQAAVQPLLEGSSGPLIVQVEKGGVRLIYVAFDLYSSDWMLRPSFPVFVARSLAWLGATGSTFPLVLARPEEPIDLGGLEGVGPISVTWPAPRGGGTPQTRKIEEVASFADTPRLGVYTLTRGDRRWQVAVNLLDAQESDLSAPTSAAPRAPSAPSAVSTPSAAGQPAGQPAPRLGSRPRLNELAPSLLLAVLGLLTLEWYWYHRRMK